MDKQTKLIIFDCDGVMFDSKAANQRFYNHLLNHFNLSDLDKEELEYVHMHNVMDSVRHIFRNYPDQDLEEVNAYRNSVNYTDFLQYMNIEEDLRAFLEMTKPDYDLAISTNRTNTMENILDIFQLRGYFGKVMTAENARRPKPAPDALLEILEHFNRRVDEAIYIGDSIIDKQHTEACGMRLISFKNPDLPADFHVTSFMEIINLPPFLKN